MPGCWNTSNSLPREFLSRFHHLSLVRLPAMLAKLQTYSLLGIEAMPVEVEVDVSPGALPKTILVGLPEAAVKESQHRIDRALADRKIGCFNSAHPALCGEGDKSRPELDHVATADAVFLLMMHAAHEHGRR